MVPAQALAILGVALATLLVLRMGMMSRYAWRRLRIAYGSDRRIPEDASSEAIPVPERARHKHGTLMELGFARLGEERVRIPTKPSGAIAWLLVGPGNKTIAHVSELHAIFATYFAERHLEITYYPSGERIQTANLRTDFCETDVPAACKAHLEQVNKASELHGRPTTISSMREYLDMQVFWRKKTGLLILRSHILWDIAVLLSTAYTAAVTVYLILSIDWQGITLTRYPPKLGLFIILLLPLLGFIIVHDLRTWRLAGKLTAAK